MKKSMVCGFVLASAIMVAGACSATDTTIKTLTGAKLDESTTIQVKADIGNFAWVRPLAVSEAPGWDTNYGGTINFAGNEEYALSTHLRYEVQSNCDINVTLDLVSPFNMTDTENGVNYKLYTLGSTWRTKRELSPFITGALGFSGVYDMTTSASDEYFHVPTGMGLGGFVFSGGNGETGQYQVPAYYPWGSRPSSTTWQQAACERDVYRLDAIAALGSANPYITGFRTPADALRVVGERFSRDNVYLQKAGEYTATYSLTISAGR